MKKNYGKKTVLILLCSLIAANHYVEYGKRVKASETEQAAKYAETAQKSGIAMVRAAWKGENGIEIETGTETETETEPETETETEPEVETETESETGMETEPEVETETESETGMETEPETETESQTETETESETETETGPETETKEEPESGTEMETEAETKKEIDIVYQAKIIRIFHIAAKLPKEGRIYDGTDQIELSYEVEGLTPESGLELQCQARLAGTDVGEWPVEYQFRLEGKNSGQYELQIEQQTLSVAVLPRTLSVILPNGWKEYGKPAEMKNIHLSGEIAVTGFLTDEKGQEIIPKGFETPKIEVDHSVVGQWSDIYENDIQKVYKNALVMKYTEEGKPTGNATKYYVFSEDTKNGGYQRGNLIIAQSGAEEGIDYEIRGEEGAICRGTDGIFWVRQGSGLQVLPLENRGYTEGWNSGPLMQGGTAAFSLKKRNKEGRITADSLEGQIRFQVDGSVPPAAVEISGVQETENVCYGKGDVYIQIHVPEDGESGIERARYFMAASQEAIPEIVPENKEWWQDCTNGMQLQLAQQGSYVIYVETEDRTGNRAYTKSRQIVIDSEKPKIVIKGVEDNSANSGKVCLAVSSRDGSYRSGSLKVEISGANGSFVPAQTERKTTDQGEEIFFADFDHIKSADDIYTVTASAEDLAGNRSKVSKTFSVNRFGSVYDLSSETKAELQQYYHREPFPVSFLETNIDYVGSVQILCKREGILTELKEKTDYFSSYSGSETGWKQYTYTIPAENFQKEGNYEVMMISRDRAENSGDSQTQKKTVKFTIDRSAPECLVTGLEAYEIYQAERLWVCLEPRDNICLKEMKVYLDGKRAAEYSKTEIQNLGGVVKWQINAREQWQRLQVQVSDEAGNQMWSEEIPFYVTEKTDKRDIPPYEKVEKSARELEEARLSLDMRKKKTGKNEEQAAAAGFEQEINAENNTYSNEKKETQGTLLPAENICGVLRVFLDKKVVFVLAGGLSLIFAALSVSIRRFRRKR